jgi:hypothetical protein
MVLDPVWIKAHAFYLGPCPPIVLGTDSIIQDKFGATLSCIDLDWQQCGRSDQDPVCTLFGHNERPLFDAQATAELRRQHDCATTAYLAG